VDILVGGREGINGIERKPGRRFTTKHVLPNEGPSHETDINFVANIINFSADLQSINLFIFGEF
jgi:hypothetical protein